MTQVYGGWIPGRPEDREKWRCLGVKGEMRFGEIRTAFGVGAFEHCHVLDKETLDLLVENGLPNVGSFSFVDFPDYMLREGAQ